LVDINPAHYASVLIAAMAKISKFEDLDCWQEARKLTLKIYEATKKEAFKKDFQLVKQIRGSSVSIMANIAEGFTRQSDKEFIHFLFIAMASAAEVMSHLYVALDQKYLLWNEFVDISLKTQKTAEIISGFLKYLRKAR
jgi:four helix bundle protein